MATRLDIFIHMDAVGRNDWQGPPDDRPLTELGWKQAERIAEELTKEKVDAIFSSPAARCRLSLEPLSKRTSLPVQVLPGFRDTLGYKAPAGWENPNREGPDPLGGAYSAGSAYAALREIAAQVPNGRAVLCSYGDIVPALMAFLAGANGAEMPPRNNKKGAVFTIVVDGEKATLQGKDAPPDFPQ
ncbi:MAG TPA: phosphoglycerate mutase family protein [Dehalococcoidia bacterium]|nr:phosphoglycerate mutase family protein [Dehalococcoidia bacterium]